MSQEEINLFCTNRGLISPMRVCVRVCVRVSAGGVAPASKTQVKMPGTTTLTCAREVLA